MSKSANRLKNDNKRKLPPWSKKNVKSGSGGVRGKHGAADQGVSAGTSGKRGRAKNPAAGKVAQDGKNAQGGGPGGGQ